VAHFSSARSGAPPVCFDSTFETGCGYTAGEMMATRHPHSKNPTGDRFVVPILAKHARMGQPQVVVIHGAEAQGWASPLEIRRRQMARNRKQASLNKPQKEAAIVESAAKSPGAEIRPVDWSPYTTATAPNTAQTCVGPVVLTRSRRRFSTRAREFRSNCVTFGSGLNLLMD
jgi:hypothetical protein